MMMNPSRAGMAARRSYEKIGVQDTAADAKTPQERGCSLAMVYPVIQRFEDLYDPQEALCAGTLFKRLELPFHKGFRL